jgi:hypothetical protein
MWKFRLTELLISYSCPLIAMRLMQSDFYVFIKYMHIYL